MAKIKLTGPVWFTSDWHFGHDREFIWKARGYSSVEEMNREQVRKFNERVAPNDEVWMLGDAVFGDLEEGIKWLQQLNGKIHIILGNHDTLKREIAYQQLGWTVHDAVRFQYKKLHFWASHYPTITQNLDERKLWQAVIALFAHTHQTTNFYNGNPYMYHVGVDSHDGYPVSIEQIVEDIRAEMKKCQELIYDKEEKND